MTGLEQQGAAQNALLAALQGCLRPAEPTLVRPKQQGAAQRPRVLSCRAACRLTEPTVVRLQQQSAMPTEVTCRAASRPMQLPVQGTDAAGHSQKYMGRPHVHLLWVKAQQVVPQAVPCFVEALDCWHLVTCTQHIAGIHSRQQKTS